MSEPYIDPVLKKYADLIHAGMPGIKRTYYGDPIRIGASELPALVLAKISTEASNLSNQEDTHRMRISLTLVTDVRDTISEDKEMVRGTNELYNLMEGRNADYSLKATTLLYILRHNVEVDVSNNLRTDLDTISRIDYGMTFGKRSESENGGWSTEATLELTAHFTQVR